MPVACKVGSAVLPDMAKIGLPGIALPQPQFATTCEPGQLYQHTLLWMCPLCPGMWGIGLLMSGQVAGA